MLLLLLLLLSTIIRQELFEIVQEIWCSLKESSDLRIDFLNRALFPLIGLQNLKKVLVDVRFISKASLLRQHFPRRKGGNLNFVDIVDSMIKLNRSFGIGSTARGSSLELSDLSV